MGYEPATRETLEMLEQQTGAHYPMEKMKEFARVRDERQLAVLDIQRRHPLPTSD